MKVGGIVVFTKILADNLIKCESSRLPRALVCLREVHLPVERTPAEVDGSQGLVSLVLIDKGILLHGVVMHDCVIPGCEIVRRCHVHLKHHFFWGSQGKGIDGIGWISVWVCLNFHITGHVSPIRTRGSAPSTRRGISDCCGVHGVGSIERFSAVNGQGGTY